MRNKDTFGGILRQVREENGYSLDGVAERLRLRTDILRAIEDCDFSRMPPRAYTKNMVGAYARLLGLDGAALIEMYLQQLDDFELSDHSFGFVEEAKDVGVSVRRPSSDSPYSTRLTSRRGSSGSSIDSDLDFVSPFRSEGRGTISTRAASSYVPNPAATRSSRLDDYPPASRTGGYAASSRLDDYPRSSRLDDYPRSSRMDDYPRSSRYDAAPRSDRSAGSSRSRRYDSQDRDYAYGQSARIEAERPRGGRYGERSVVNGYEALSRGTAGTSRHPSSQRPSQAMAGSSRRLRDGGQDSYAPRGRSMVDSRGSSRGGYDEGRPSHRAQMPRKGNEMAQTKGLSGGGRYDSIYSRRSPLQMIFSKLPLIIGAVLIIVLAIVLVSCINGKGKASDDAALNNDGTPITGVDDPAASGLDTGESQQPSTQTAVPIAPTAAVFSYEVSDGKSAYIEIYIDGGKSPVVADEIQGPSNGNYDVTGTLEFVTTNPESVTCMVDGEKVKVKDKDGDGVYTYTVDFKKILKKWKEKNLKSDDSSSTAASSSGDAASGSGESAGAEAA